MYIAEVFFVSHPDSEYVGDYKLCCYRSDVKLDKNDMAIVKNITGGLGIVKVKRLLKPTEKLLKIATAEVVQRIDLDQV